MQKILSVCLIIPFLCFSNTETLAQTTVIPLSKYLMTRIVSEIEIDSSVHSSIKDYEVKSVIESAVKSSGFSVNENSYNITQCSITFNQVKPNSKELSVKLQVRFITESADAMEGVETDDSFLGNKLFQQKFIEQLHATDVMILNSVQSMAQSVMNEAKKHIMRLYQTKIKPRPPWNNRRGTFIDEEERSDSKVDQ